MLAFLSGTFLQDMKSQRLRLVLTLFGIVWGTVAVVVLLAFGTGLERQAQEMMGRDATAITLQSGMAREPFRGLPPDRPIRLRADDATLLRTVPEIRLVSEVNRNSRPITSGAKSTQASILGVDPEYAEIQRVAVLPGGRMLNSVDVSERRRVAVIGRSAREELFGGQPALGRSIVVAGSHFIVIGEIAPREGSMAGGRDGRVIIPATTYRILYRTNRVSSLLIAPASAEVSDRALQQAFAVLGARHRFDADDRRALQPWGTFDMDREIRYFMLGLKAFLAIVGGFTLLVGGIGVANIMFVVVRERRVEIGVKRAMGARRIHILVQFMLEAVLLVALGALLGFLIAVSIVQLASLIPAMEEMGKPVISGAVAVGTGLVLAIVALAAGLFPARAAARLDPVVCLRG